MHMFIGALAAEDGKRGGVRVSTQGYRPYRTAKTAVERKRLSFVHNSAIVLKGPCSNELPVAETAFEQGPTEVVGHELDLPPSLRLATCHLVRKVADGDLVFLGHVELDGQLLDVCVILPGVLGARTQSVASGGIARTNLKAG